MKGRAVFLDKDGTLVEDVPHNADPALIRLMPRAAEGLRALRGLGYGLVVVTNQPGVARGLFPEDALGGVERRLRELLGEEGVLLDGFYYCPHLPGGSVAAYAVSCACRKPAPGLLLRAARDLDLDLPRSWMAGDILDDAAAGRRAGCRTVLIDNGHETEWDISAGRLPDVNAADLAEAAGKIARAEACLA